MVIDENTKLFHRSIRARRVQNNVYAISDLNGVWRDKPEEITEAFLSYYKILMAPYTADEVKSALFSIPGDKAPGPDGFGGYFFKDTWEVGGGDVAEAVLDFFTSKKMLKELNATIITLAPKFKCPAKVSDFRPISCCNTLYKCITKVIYGRLRQVLPDIVAENQGGFVHGRYIIHHVMVVQDLVKKYNRKNASPSCMIKMDLQKAYDTVD
ncbi:uncharacterized protein LOC104902800 [Beta vulgaris subsp. vulgaris]|uniref:uncharacterized protein LOC104902800 n=1 Tax=Beta vulgaris subsp. vulgaris TaxID=3555 RepID=UPI00053F60B1|nr:uncharacterized protein LOC104902800 [Beta vulgaris subsp. vulgaris]